MSDRDIRIIVAQRGWVVVGEYVRDGDILHLAHASTIRRWGTTRGLGEIAEGGPNKGKTVLDPCGSVELHILGAVLVMRCDAKNWREVIK